jgi:hypothetical protein
MRRQGWLAALAVTICLTAGCGGDDESGLTEEDLKRLGIPTAPEKEAEESPSDSQTRLTSFSQPAPDAPEGELKLSLQIGARFPIQKTITQTLVQKGVGGTTTTTTKSILSMLFAIVVEAEEDGLKLMNVRYQRVRYAHELPGERVEYDSADPPEVIPPAALVYHGLVGNGFRFWLGADNQIAEVVGFDDFLKRCVRHVPQGQQEALLAQIVATQEDEGFSNFIDHSIGLLPYNPKATGRETAVKVGETWDAPKQLLMRPIPMSLDTQYTLTSLTDDYAHVNIFGTISPARSTPMGQNATTQSSEIVTLTGGHTIGNCVLFRETGLPMRSRVERRIDMKVQIDERRKFDQHKTIVTTVEGLPTDRAFLLPDPRPGVARAPGTRALPREE